ncbi:sensor histidine kinase [Pseudogemmobacter sonorensis]|uniref:sensor histidine kinase n=1 Tax=Pseudogemmobacter sonorensis TaxID=2989681 RepID=UPI00368014C3
MMMLALLPLGLLSLGQTRNILSTAENGQRLAAMGETLRTAEPEIAAIRASQEAAKVLALVIGQMAEAGGQPDAAACQALVEGIAAADPRRRVVAFVPASGIVSCVAGGAGGDFSAHPLFREIVARTGPGLSSSGDGVISGIPVLSVSHPVRAGAAADGEIIGYIGISMPHRALTPDFDAGDQAEIFHGVKQLLGLTTFDTGGRLLTASDESGGNDTRLLPQGRDLAELASGGRQSFFAPDMAGERRLFTVLPLAGGLFLLGTWQTTPGEGLLPTLELHPFAFPLLMWVAGLVVAMLGAERLVLRHLRRLSRAIRTFTATRNAPAPALDDPPQEIALLAEAYLTMTATILRDEAELENLIRQKEELLREVHHRTGNSLQLIASILRMHRRETHDPGVLSLVDNLHDRVMGLSTVHLGLYRIAGRADVAMDALISEVIAKVGTIRWRGEGRDRIEARLDPLMLSAQQAVPLALLLAEILSCFSSADLDAEAPPVRICLSHGESGLARLALAIPPSARATLTGARDGTPSIIAARLIKGFVAQLEGRMEVTDLPRQIEVGVTFTPRLVEAASTTGKGPGDGTPHPGLPNADLTARLPAGG